MIEYIKKTYILNEVSIKKEHFIPIVFDLKNIHRKQKLLNEPKFLNEAIKLNLELEKYLIGRTNLTYLDINNFFVGFYKNSKDLTEKLRFKKVINGISANLKFENQLQNILKIVFKDIKDRIEYENEQESEHKKIESIIKRPFILNS